MSKFKIGLFVNKSSVTCTFVHKMKLSRIFASKIDRKLSLLSDKQPRHISPMLNTPGSVIINKKSFGTFAKFEEFKKYTKIDWSKCYIYHCQNMSRLLVLLTF